MDNHKKPFQKLHLLIDNPDSWFWKYADNILDTLKDFGQEVKLFRNALELEKGDILFILSCDRILTKENLRLHKNNIVIHGGDLPLEKGWSPWIWQVEKGKDEIILTLFEAVEKLDSGGWYLKDKIKLSGNELIEDLRKALVKTENKLIREYLLRHPLEATKQKGNETIFQKRTSDNQEIDISLSIQNQFNKLRVCDNERYPAHFSIKGSTYILKVYRA